MNADNWEDIPLEPKSMDYEGTARPRSLRG